MRAYSNSPRLLRVFLCHSSSDKPVVRQLYKRLVSEGFEPWLDEEKLLPGIRWKEEISTAVRESDVVIACLSRNSISKTGFVQREIKFALDVALEQPEGSIFLIPLRLEECDVPDSLNEWHWVNFFEDNGYERLMKALSYRAAGLGVELSPSSQESDKPKHSSETISEKIHDEVSSKSKSSIELPTGEDTHGVKTLKLAVGIETLGGIFTKLIPEETQLPHRFAEIFSTATDNQTSVEVHVLAGLRPLAKDNLSIGRFHLVGIPPAPRGIPQIEVIFDIDTNGVVDVSAKDVSTGRQQKITINSFKPSKEEIDHIMRDAQLHTAEDTQKKTETGAFDLKGKKDFREIFNDLFGNNSTKR